LNNCALHNRYFWEKLVEDFWEEEEEAKTCFQVATQIVQISQCSQLGHYRASLALLIFFFHFHLLVFTLHFT
jgi:hypothetical protein